MTILYAHLSRDEDIYLTRAAQDIFKHYGRAHQETKLAEEMAEYIAAWTRFRNDPSEENANACASEFADVLLVAEQFANSFQAKAGRDIAQIMLAKADRQLRRISKEKEEKKCSPNRA